MSYTLIVQSTKKSDIKKALSSAEVVDEFFGEHGADGIQAHLDAIADAVGNLAGVVGRDSDQVSVEITGHANPSGEPIWDKSNDVLSVTVRQIAKRPPAPVGTPPAEANESGVEPAPTEETPA